MNEKNDPDNKTNTTEDERSLGEFWTVTLWVLGCVAGLILISAFWFVVSYALDPKLTDPVGFVGVSVLNTLIFTAIIAQVLIYRKQWQVMENQLQQARSHAVTIERPFVFLHAVNWQYHPDPNRPGRYLYTIRPELRNSGNLPTVDMTVGIRYDFREAVLPDGFEFPLDLDAKGPTIIPPGEDLRIATYTLTDDQLIAIQKDTRYLYFWGEATYKDGFQGTPIHTTHFCQCILGVGGDPTHPSLAGENATQIVFAFYRTHNSGD